MGLGKWIGSAMGFMTMGPLGALAGYAIGHFLWLAPSGEFTAVADFFFRIIPDDGNVGHPISHILRDIGIPQIQYIQSEIRGLGH